MPRYEHVIHKLRYELNAEAGLLDTPATWLRRGLSVWWCFCRLVSAPYRGLVVVFWSFCWVFTDFLGFAGFLKKFTGFSLGLPGAGCFSLRVFFLLPVFGQKPLCLDKRRMFRKSFSFGLHRVFLEKIGLLGKKGSGLCFW